MDQHGAQLYKNNSCHATTTKYTIPRTNKYVQYLSFYQYFPTECFTQSYMKSLYIWCTKTLVTFIHSQWLVQPVFFSTVPLSSILLNKVAKMSVRLRVHAKYNHSAKRVRSFSNAGRKQEIIDWFLHGSMPNHWLIDFCIKMTNRSFIGNKVWHDRHDTYKQSWRFFGVEFSIISMDSTMAPTLAIWW